MSSGEPDGSGAFGTFEEWKYRHEFFWAATIRWLITVVAVAAVPYSSTQVRDSFGGWALLFPAFACLLGLVAFVHLLAEHARAVYVRWHVGYRENENRFLEDRSGILTSRAQMWLRFPIRWRIGPYIFAALSLGLFSLTGSNLLFFVPYLRKARSEAPSPILDWMVIRFGLLWVVVGVATALVLILVDRKRYSDSKGNEIG